MFTKLLKHNLRPIIKAILPLVIALFVSVILFNITAYDVEYVYDTMPDGKHILVDTILPSAERQFFHGLFNFTTSCSLILLFAATIRSVWRQFKTSFYSDRAYLTHTIPVSRQMLWGAEICSVAITLVGIIASAVISCLILALTRNGAQFLESFGLIGGCSHCVGEYYYVEPLSLGLYFSYAFLVFIELAFIALCGMSGIILKNRFGRKISLTSGIGIYLVGCIILLIIYYIASTINPGIINIFSSYPGTLTPGQQIDYDPIMSIMLYVGIIYTCYCVILYFVDRKLLRRGINLD